MNKPSAREAHRMLQLAALPRLQAIDGFQLIMSLFGSAATRRGRPMRNSPSNLRGADLPVAVKPDPSARSCSYFGGSAGFGASAFGVSAGFAAAGAASACFGAAPASAAL